MPGVQSNARAIGSRAVPRWTPGIQVIRTNGCASGCVLDDGWLAPVEVKLNLAAPVAPFEMARSPAPQRECTPSLQGPLSLHSVDHTLCGERENGQTRSRPTVLGKTG